MDSIPFSSFDGSYIRKPALPSCKLRGRRPRRPVTTKLDVSRLPLLQPNEIASFFFLAAIKKCLVVVHALSLIPFLGRGAESFPRSVSFECVPALRASCQIEERSTATEEWAASEALTRP